MERHTRREFLGQLTFATVAAARGMTPAAARGVAPKRVIIVGAGLAGLCAAYELGALGHDVTALEAQTRPGGRVQTLRDPFDDGLFAEAGASRIPTSHDLTLGYARMFGLTLIPFEPVSVPSIRYAYRQRSRIEPNDPFEWPSNIPAEQKRLTPAEVRGDTSLRSSTRSPIPSRPHGCRSHSGNTTVSHVINTCARRACPKQRCT